jgi:type I restriction enzyme M protein
MAIKKFELYSSLWSSCDALRGSMDASQYKDYVLVRLFVKYVSDKYAGVPHAPITIPPGASFKYMVAMKGKPDIGDQINKKIIGPLANAIYNEIDRISQALAQRVKELAERYETLLPMLTSKVPDLSAKVAAHLK